MKIVYKCKKTGIVKDSVDLNEFIGYRVQIDHNKISKVTEFKQNNVLATITYRPTKIPLIQKVEYYGHVENRYNNNQVSSQYFEHNDKLYGEYKRYDINGNLESRTYYYDGKDVTNEIINFIGYKEEPSEFKFYVFQEDEMFNLMARYGHYFRFCFESDRYSSEFDEITKYCQLI